jgi:O-antigen/teichoic acid export membrane protein
MGAIYYRERMSDSENQVGLRSLVMRGGVHLGLRQLLGLVINVGGVLLLTRATGPGAYGRFAAASSFYFVVQLLAQLGIGVYLVRSETALSRRTQDQAATLFGLLGLVGLAIGSLIATQLDNWTAIPGVTAITLVMLLALPLVNVGQVSIALLDRGLAFKRSAWIELTSQALFFLVSIPLALKGLGSWAVVAGWWAQQLTMITGGTLATRYFPRPVWEPAVAQDMVRYGLSFSASVWIYQLRRLANPLIVGRYLGSEAVAIVSLCSQLIIHLGFVSTIAWRIATASFARVQNDATRMLRAIGDGMWLQLLGIGPIFLLFAWAGPIVVPRLLGESWAQLAQIYPFLAVVFLINALFVFHSSALYVVRRNLQMAMVHLVQVVALAIAAIVLVPRYGLIGYGFAELATLLSYPLMHTFLARSIGVPSYARVLPAAFAFGFALFWTQLGPVSLIGLFVTVLLAPFWPETRRLLAELRTIMVGS